MFSFLVAFGEKSFKLFKSFLFSTYNFHVICHIIAARSINGQFVVIRVYLILFSMDFFLSKEFRNKGILALCAIAAPVRCGAPYIPRFLNSLEL